MNYELPRPRTAQRGRRITNYKKLLPHYFIALLVICSFIFSFVLMVTPVYAGTITICNAPPYDGHKTTTSFTNAIERQNWCDQACAPDASGTCVDTPVQNTTGNGIIPDNRDQKKTGDYTLNDFAQIAVNISSFILGIVGSLALLAFVAGGVMFLISAGSSEKVTRAKQIIFGAVVGLVIVFTSYMIINFVAEALGIIDSGESILKSGGWF